MKRVIKLLAVFIGVCVAAAISQATGAKAKSSFTLAQVKNGKYAPWRDPRTDNRRYYAGEVTTISGTKFRYTYFTDVDREEEITPDFSGTLKIYEDHIYLDHPGVPYPHRITGLLDGVFVMTTWSNYEHWKKFGSMPEYGTLFLQKE